MKLSFSELMDVMSGVKSKSTTKVPTYVVNNITNGTSKSLMSLLGSIMQAQKLLLVSLQPLIKLQMTKHGVSVTSNSITHKLKMNSLYLNHSSPHSMDNSSITLKVGLLSMYLPIQNSSVPVEISVLLEDSVYLELNQHSHVHSNYLHTTNSRLHSNSLR